GWRPTPLYGNQPHDEREDNCVAGSSCHHKKCVETWEHLEGVNSPPHFSFKIQARAALRSGALLMALLAMLCLLTGPTLCSAQEPPFFVTYSDPLEGPGNFEFAFKSAIGTPKYSNRFMSGTFEFEYGVTGWWTTEVYVQGQHTSNEWTLFTG